MLNRFFIGISLTVLCLAACSANKNGNATTDKNKEPVTRASIRSIRLNHEMGMMPGYSVLFLSQDSCYFEKGNYRNTPEKDYFSLTEKEWLELEAVFTQQDFRNINTRKEPRVADRGGYTIQVEYTDGPVSISDAHTSFVVDEHTERWKTILNKLLETLTLKTGKKP